MNWYFPTRTFYSPSIYAVSYLEMLFEASIQHSITVALDPLYSARHLRHISIGCFLYGVTNSWLAVSYLPFKYRPIHGDLTTVISLLAPSNQWEECYTCAASFSKHTSVSGMHFIHYGHLIKHGLTTRTLYVQGRNGNVEFFIFSNHLPLMYSFDKS